eukprot:TRINITY_DN2009_c0_g1_i1.p1 TRINITY_DN2009_c0_g1~~TRINITY_DN2009_c0_g1_i1.p1  ORF type:complete len:407 (+),score=39.33 TRINITY_DN2009_c0_g1_i1:99-1319(+)
MCIRDRYMGNLKFKMELSESSSEKSSESKQQDDQVEQLFESIIERKENINQEKMIDENDKTPIKTKAKQLEEMKKKSSGKSNQPSYLELFENFIYNDSLWVNQHNQGKQKYTLLEDIALIYFIGADSINIENLDNDQLGPSFFKHLKRAGFFTDRTIESLRDRYRKYLSCLTSKDIVKIGSWLLENGVEKSYLEFKMNNEVKQKQLWKIVKYKEDENTNKEQPLPQYSSLNIKRRIEDFNRFTHERKLDKKVKLEIDDLLKANKQKIWQAGPFWMFLKQEDEWKVSNAKRPLTITTNFSGQRVIFLDTAKEENQFNKQMEQIEQQYGIEKTQLLVLLDSLSGNINDLCKYLQTQDSSILWSDENDSTLAQVKSYSDPSFRLLIKSKGIERVRNRIQYKKFWLPIQV